MGTRQASRPYQVVEALAEVIPGVLLLTATPDQLGHESHFARLRLLDPDRFYDYETFVEEEEQYQTVAHLAQRLQEQHPLTAEDEAALQSYVAPERLQQLRNAEGDALVTMRQEVLKQLLDQHGTGRLLFRNSRASIQGFPKRCFKPQPFDLPEQYQTAMRVMARMQERQDPKKQIAVGLAPEQVYQDFDGGRVAWWEFDPRVSWLVDYLCEYRSKKVLVITQKAETALLLEEALRLREGIRATVFHEGMSIIERDKAGAYFAQVEGGAQALICSEIGSEGRNFQFASDLVLFDLPQNPDLLEQRIGRLDRIGQKNDIHIHVPFFKSTPQEFLVDWYHFGLNAFEQTCPTGQALQSQFAAEVEQAMLLPELGAASLLKDTAAARVAMMKNLEEGRDQLLELNSHGGEAAKALTEKLKAQDQVAFIQFILTLWDVIGVEQEDKGDHLMILRPHDQMLYPYPGLPEDGITITFDRDVALSRDDVVFMTPEHPLVQTGIDLILDGDTGSTSVALLKNKAMPVGTVFLELMYVADASAPRSSQVFRYFPETPIRVLLDQQGNDLSDRVDFQTFHKQLSPVNRHTGIKLVNAAQSIVHPLLEKGLNAAKARAGELKIEAKAEMESTLSAELQRLTALKAVNPAIRQVELDHVQDQQHAIAHYIEQSQVRLDAVRLILVSHQ